MYIIAFVNQKGGVGKSTLSLNVSSALGHAGARVVLIDLDPQATSTAATLGTADRKGTADLLDYANPDRLRIADLAMVVPEWSFAIVPATYESLRQREAGLSEDPQSGQFALLDALATDEHAADIVIIDCPPNYGPLTSAALVAANGIVAPIEAAGESTHGLAQLERRIAGAKRVNSQLTSLGIVIIGYQSRLRVDQDVHSFVNEGTSFGWVETIRQTNGFKRGFIEQKPLRTIASTEAEKAAVGEIATVADRLLNHILAVTEPVSPEIPIATADSRVQVTNAGSAIQPTHDAPLSTRVESEMTADPTALLEASTIDVVADDLSGPKRTPSNPPVSSLRTPTRESNADAEPQRHSLMVTPSVPEHPMAGLDSAEVSAAVLPTVSFETSTVTAAEESGAMTNPAEIGETITEATGPLVAAAEGDEDGTGTLKAVTA